jgi:hypothetical protein
MLSAPDGPRPNRSSQNRISPARSRAHVPKFPQSTASFLESCSRWLSFLSFFLKVQQRSYPHTPYTRDMTPLVLILRSKISLSLWFLCSQWSASSECYSQWGFSTATPSSWLLVGAWHFFTMAMAPMTWCSFLDGISSSRRRRHAGGHDAPPL